MSALLKIGQICMLLLLNLLLRYYILETLNVICFADDFEYVAVHSMQTGHVSRIYTAFKFGEREKNPTYPKKKWRKKNKWKKYLRINEILEMRLN